MNGTWHEIKDDNNKIRCREYVIDDIAVAWVRASGGNSRYGYFAEIRLPSGGVRYSVVDYKKYKDAMESAEKMLEFYFRENNTGE